VTDENPLQSALLTDFAGYAFASQFIEIVISAVLPEVSELKKRHGNHLHIRGLNFLREKQFL
jgi:hypothetical protein